MCREEFSCEAQEWQECRGRQRASGCPGVEEQLARGLPLGSLSLPVLWPGAWGGLPSVRWRRQQPAATPVELGLFSLGGD